MNDQLKKSVTESDAAKAEAAKKAAAQKVVDEAKAKAEQEAKDKAAADAAAKSKEDTAKAEAAKNESKRNVAILSAITKLQHSVDGDWTEAGFPSVARVAELSGITDVSRAEIIAAADGFARQRVEAGASSELTTGYDAGHNPEDDDLLENVTIRATGKGYYNGRLIKPGEETNYTGAPAKWFDVIKR